MDEAASMIRTEIDSMPAELDECSRKIMQLEIEKQALSKESDEASKERLKNIGRELADLRGRVRCNECAGERKQAITQQKATKQRIEEVRHEIEEAVARYDLEKLAELKYGVLRLLRNSCRKKQLK